MLSYIKYCLPKNIKCFLGLGLVKTLIFSQKNSWFFYNRKHFVNQKILWNIFRKMEYHYNFMLNLFLKVMSPKHCHNFSSFFLEAQVLPFLSFSHYMYRHQHNWKFLRPTFFLYFTTFYDLEYVSTLNTGKWGSLLLAECQKRLFFHLLRIWLFVLILSWI